MAMLIAALTQCVTRLAKGVMCALAVLALWYSAAASCAELLVGQVAPRSGAQGQLAYDYEAGARLYFASINAQGGVNGATIVLAAKDDGNDPASARRYTTELVARKPIAFIGTVGTANLERVLPQLQASQIALLGPLLEARRADQASNGTVFHIGLDNRQQIEAIVGRLDSLSLHHIVLCYDNWSDSADTELWTRIQKRRRPIEVLNCGGNMAQADSAANTVIAKAPQAVVFFGQTDAAAAFIRTMRARGSFALIVLPSSIDMRQLAAMLPETAQRWVAVAEVIGNFGREEWSADSIAQEFSRLRASTAGVPSSSASLAGFVSAKVLVDAIRHSGDKPTAAAVLKTLRSMQRYGSSSVTFSFARKELLLPSDTRLGHLDKAGVGLN